MRARSATTTLPGRVLAERERELRLGAPVVLARPISSRMKTFSRRGFETSMPTTGFPGIGARMRTESARSAIDEVVGEGDDAVHLDAGRRLELERGDDRPGSHGDDLADDAEVGELGLEDARAGEQRRLVERLRGAHRLVEEGERRQAIGLVGEELLLPLGLPRPLRRRRRLRPALGLTDDRRAAAPPRAMTAPRPRRREGSAARVRGGAAPGAPGRLRRQAATRASTDARSRRRATGPHPPPPSSAETPVASASPTTRRPPREERRPDHADEVARRRAGEAAEPTAAAHAPPARRSRARRARRGSPRRSRRRRGGAAPNSSAIPRGRSATAK